MEKLRQKGFLDEMERVAAPSAKEAADGEADKQMGLAA